MFQVIMKPMFEGREATVYYFDSEVEVVNFLVVHSVWHCEVNRL